MTTRRATTTRRRPTSGRTPAKQRRVQVRNPVVIHRRRRPKRKTVIAVGGVVSLVGALAALIGALFSVLACVVMIVVTILTALATVVMAILSDGDTGPARVARPAPKADPAAVRCGAPTTTKGGTCQRKVRRVDCPIHGSKGHKPVSTP